MTNRKQGLNSLTAKSVLVGEKLILFGRYILNLYVGIVPYRQNLLTDTMHKLANIK